MDRLPGVDITDDGACQEKREVEAHGKRLSYYADGPRPWLGKMAGNTTMDEKKGPAAVVAV